MTNAEIDALVERLRELRAAATAGPYRAHDHNNMKLVGEDPEKWIGYAWVGRITENSHPNGAFDAGWLKLDRRKDACKEYRERASADAHFVAEALNALPDILSLILSLQKRNAELVEGMERLMQATDDDDMPLGLAQARDQARSLIEQQDTDND